MNTCEVLEWGGVLVHVVQNVHKAPVTVIAAKIAKGCWDMSEITELLLGKMNNLRVVDIRDGGFVLAAESKSKKTAWLDRRAAPELNLGDSIEVFVYGDGKDRLVATTTYPEAMVGEVAYLRVVQVQNMGVFLDMGIPKDLFLPKGEQTERLASGDYCCVYVYKDKFSERMVATQRFNRHIGKTEARYDRDQKVKIQAVAKTDLGYKVVVNNSHWGLIYHDDVVGHIERGERRAAWVTRVVDDNKLDLHLNPPKKERYSQQAERVLEALEAADGSLNLHDKSPPEEIRSRLGMSKKDFKAAIGQLYKGRMIFIERGGGITLR